MNLEEHRQAAHELIDSLFSRALEQKHRAEILEKALWDILRVGKTTFQRNLMIDIAADAIAESHPKYRDMTFQQQNDFRWVIRFSQDCIKSKDLPIS